MKFDRGKEMKISECLSGIVIILAFFVNANAIFAGDPKRGKKIYQMKCQSCHGVGGDAGNKGGLKEAANFAKLEANPERIRTLLANLSEEDHKKIVREGGEKSGVAGAGSAMPKLGIPEKEIDDVVAFERTLPAFKSASKRKR
jgi:mono/diheme cytochrome c family protein